VITIIILCASGSLVSWSLVKPSSLKADVVLAHVSLKSHGIAKYILKVIRPILKDDSARPLIIDPAMMDQRTCASLDAVYLEKVPIAQKAANAAVVIVHVLQGSAKRVLQHPEEFKVSDG
jgi:hypothetical protein